MLNRPLSIDKFPKRVDIDLTVYISLELKSTEIIESLFLGALIGPHVTGLTSVCLSVNILGLKSWLEPQRPWIRVQVETLLFTTC